MKKLLFILILSSVAYAQNPNILWQNTINAVDFDTVYTSVNTSDGGTLLVTTSNSDASGDKSENSNGGNDIWLIKVDNLGVIEWEETIGGSLSDFINAAYETADGGFILGGGSKSNISGDKTENNIGENDVWVIKINATGTIEWQKTIGGSSSDSVRSLGVTNDGNYIIAAASQSGVSGDKTEASKGQIDIWLLKIDNSGNIIWQKTIGSNNDDVPTSIKETSDGGYIVGSYSNSDISGDKTEALSGFNDFWVIKTDNVGSIEWENTIGGNKADILRDIEILDSGNYLLAGYSDSDISLDKTENSRGTFDYWIMELNSDGMPIWQKTLGGDDEDFAFNIEITSDNNYLIAGQSKSDISGEKSQDSKGGIDFWPIKINATGTMIWQKTIGGNGNDYLTVAHETTNGYILSGHSFSDVSDDKTEDSSFIDPWIIKLDKEPTASLQENQLATINIYPNPTTSKVFIDNHSITTIILYDIRGNRILKTTKKEIDLSYLSPGLYIAKIFNSNMKVVSLNKILKQ
jgi:hypothetical protein